ncbi:hypothetical protein, partial [Duganella qianjiadongensis]|uniref:hypothetical protein n=1 Tax=Duganella qianjiadongensis TaxID=2692176 RepID=UPI001E4E3B75
CSPWHSMTIRTERSITSGECLDFFIDPFSQIMEPPSFPERFSTLWSFSFERQFLITNTLKGFPPTSIVITNGDGSSTTFSRYQSAYKADIASADSLYPLTSEYDEWVYKRSSGKIEHKKIQSRFLLTSITKSITGLQEVGHIPSRRGT